MEEKIHKRRVHYSGTHPKRFEEKYKEHDPEKYADTIEKVISKGSTPAGMHISICVNEILDFLQIQPGQQGLDATLGYGGHTRRMLEKLQGKGHMYALDVDPIETNFRNIDQVAEEAGGFDFILADLGVSSMQIDNPDRGFTYKFDGPLDLRLDPEKGESAAERLREVSYEELVGMFQENSDEPYAEEIATVIMKRNRTKNYVETTTQMKDAIEEALAFVPEKDRKEAVKKSCQRCFQALRIDVNSEFEVLYDFLDKLPDALRPGGKVAILTFHSGEDRLVKRAFKAGVKAGVYSEVSKDVIRPSAEGKIDEDEMGCKSRIKDTERRHRLYIMLI